MKIITIYQVARYLSSTFFARVSFYVQLIVSFLTTQVLVPIWTKNLKSLSDSAVCNATQTAHRS